VKTRSEETDSGRRSTLSLPEDLDIRLTVFARKHRLTRSNALAQAVAQLCRGMRIGFGASESEDEEAA
jgi:predicted transcriptional regulator